MSTEKEIIEKWEFKSAFYELKHYLDDYKSTKFDTRYHDEFIMRAIYKLNLKHKFINFLEEEIRTLDKHDGTGNPFDD